MKKNPNIISEIDRARLKLSIEHYIKYFIGKRTCEITKDEALEAISLAVREFAMDKMYETIARYNKCNSKRIYYLSIEYLIGRSLENNLHNLGLFDILKNIKIDGLPDFSLEENGSRERFGTKGEVLGGDVRRRKTFKIRRAFRSGGHSNSAFGKGRGRRKSYRRLLRRIGDKSRR